MNRYKSFIQNPKNIVFVLFPLCFVFWFVSYRYHLLYLEESGFFVQTTDYFKQSLEQPGGLSGYIGSFLTQFYQWPVTGAVLQVLFLVILLGCVRGIVNRLLPGDSWAVFRILPALFLFALQCSYVFTVAESICVVCFFACVYLYVYFNKQNLRYLFFTAVLPLIFLLLPSGGVLFLYATFIVYECWKGRGKIRFFIIPLWIVLPLCLPWIWEHVVALIHGNRRYAFYGIYFDSFQKYLMCITYGYALLLMAYAAIPGKWTTKKSVFVYVLNVCLILGSGYYLFHHSYKKEYEQLLAMDYEIRHDEERKALERFESVKNIKEGQYMATLALAKLDLLPESLMEFPVNESSCFYLTHSLNYLTLVWGSELYQALGIENEVIRWNLEAASMTPWSADFRTLKSLIDAHIRKQDYRLAEKYLSILSDATLYGDWVMSRYKEIENLKKSEPLEQPEFGGNNFFIGGRPFLSDMARVIDIDPSNLRALDYILCGVLLDRELGKFATIFKQIVSPQTDVLPRLYEEAALLAITDLKDQELKNYKFRLETIKEFQDFNKIQNSFNGNPHGAKNALQKYQDTYWYYVQFVAPPEKKK